jgi:6-phosphofructokinase 1
LGVSTGGGDCAGLNAILRALVLCARTRADTAIIGILEGINGLSFDPPKTKNLYIPGGEGVDEFVLENLLTLGGTYLTTSNAGNPFKEPGPAADAFKKSVVRGYQKLGLDGLIVVGGDGTHSIAAELADAGVKLIGIPKTIDNDYMDSELAVGFTSAVDVAAEALLSVKTSGASHGRIMVVEVMGRNAGFIALNSGIAAGADAILLPERPFSYEDLGKHLSTKVMNLRNHALVVCAEGAHASGEAIRYRASSSGTKHLGGIGDAVATWLHQNLGCETRCTALGHTQRGSRPVPVDRILAARFATKAMRLALEKRFGTTVVLKKGEVEVGQYPAPRSRGGSGARRLDPRDPTIITAQDLGIYCGGQG